MPLLPAPVANTRSSWAAENSQPVTRKNQRLKQPSTEDVPQVQSCWAGYERFAMLAAIALGLLQLIALKFSVEVWGQSHGFLRTRSRSLPSERTVKDVVGPWCSKISSMSHPVRQCKHFGTGFLRTKKLYQTAARPLRTRLLRC